MRGVIRSRSGDGRAEFRCGRFPNRCNPGLRESVEHTFGSFRAPLMHWRSRPVPNLGSGSVSGYPTYRELQRFGSCYTLTGRGQVMPPDIWIGTIEISWTNEE